VIPYSAVRLGMYDGLRWAYRQVMRAPRRPLAGHCALRAHAHALLVLPCSARVHSGAFVQEYRGVVGAIAGTTGALSEGARLQLRTAGAGEGLGDACKSCRSMRCSARSVTGLEMRGPRAQKCAAGQDSRVGAHARFQLDLRAHVSLAPPGAAAVSGAVAEAVAACARAVRGHRGCAAGHDGRVWRDRGRRVQLRQLPAGGRAVRAARARGQRRAAPRLAACGAWRLHLVPPPPPPAPRSAQAAMSSAVLRLR